MSSSSVGLKASPQTQDLVIRLIVGGAVAFIVWKLLGRVFSGLTDAVARPFGYGLTAEEQSLVDSRLDPGPLNVAMYGRQDFNGTFADAPQADRQWVQQSAGYLQDIANAIADAPGYVNDNEAGLLDAIGRVPSLYALLWVNKRLLGSPNVRTLGVFSPDMPPPNIGRYMDAFLEPRDWLRVMQYVSTLPKYLNA